MPSYSTPGVYVNETLLSSLATPATGGVTVAVFFGETERGPTIPVLINDWSTFKTLYGDLSNAYDLGYSVYHYFANGGRSCYVYRIVGSPSASAGNTFPFYPLGTDGASAGMFQVSAISPGIWGNALTVETARGTTPASTTAYGTFTLVVKLGGVEMERWTDLSLDANDNRYAAIVVNTYSRFIRISALNTSASAGTAASGAFFPSPVMLAGGTQTSVGTNTAPYTTAVAGIGAINGNLLLNAVGQTSPEVISALVTEAARRGDSFVIVDPGSIDTNVSDIQRTASNFSGLGSPGYCAQYVPRLIMVDPGKTGPGAVRVTYPGGAVAGLFVRTEVERTVAKAPAGYAADIRGALGLEVRLSDADIGALYDGVAQVNSFKAITGGGVVVYGARTFSRTRPDKFVSVRRTLNYLKTSLKDMSSMAVFEANDERLWVKLNMRISGFLSDFWRSGGLKGQRAGEAFYVLCDSTNNTANSIDQGIVNIDVGVALQYPAEFIVITISQWTGGSNVVESI